MKQTAYRNVLLACTALATIGFMPTQALAQAVAPAAEGSSGGLEEIVVTAQKREQNLQDVPIAVTALSGDTLAANRVTSVSDLTGLAPGVIIRTAAGGSQLPSFSIRGAISYGVVPGSDKQVSLYIDGVYLAYARGAIFDLPDIQRIEMLRGPQGTLFGRNATAGAVSITTREPTGEFGVKTTFTVGNYDHYRARVTVDTPQVGAFSGYLSYVRNYKRGDIRNANPGQLWDRTAAGLGISRSPEFLGTKDSDSYFVALKLEPSDRFKMVYKYDLNNESGTPEGTGFVGLNAAAPGIGALAGPFFNALLTTQSFPVYTAADGKRPEVVNNSWAIPTRQKNYGHSLTATLKLNDSLTLKNIAAYRFSRIFATSPIDGFSGLTFTAQTLAPYATFAGISALAAQGVNVQDPANATLVQNTITTIATQLAPLVGQPFVGIATSPYSQSKQWSDELQLNYNSEKLDLTVGAIWFHSDEQSGIPGMAGNTSFTPVFGGIVVGNQAVNYNLATSLAAYAQAEIHVTPQLDIIGGIRLTNDKKSGSLVYGAPGALTTVPFTYNRTKPNYLIGVNYKPNDDILIYGKFSTAFVSGGSVTGQVFEPETATSWEAGLKADLLDKKLRTNLALYHVTYKNFQTAQGGNNFPSLFPTPPYPPGFSNFVGLIIVPQGGPVKAKGFELEVTAAPSRGLSFGGNLAYMDTKFEAVNPVLLAQAGGDYQPALRAPWTGGLWGQYETQPLFGDATLMLRMDGQWHSLYWQSQNRVNLVPQFKGIDTVPASWNVNARAAIRNINLGGSNSEIAVWVRNLTQNREATFALQTLRMLGSANYVPARTVGADLTIQF